MEFISRINPIIMDITDSLVDSLLFSILVKPREAPIIDTIKHTADPAFKNKGNTRRKFRLELFP